MHNAREARIAERIEKLLPRPERRKAARRPIHHISSEFLILHVLGDLPIFQRIDVEEHLSKCHACREQVREMEQVIAMFRGEV